MVYNLLKRRFMYENKDKMDEVDVTIEDTAEEHNITVDNPSTVSKEKEKVEPVSSGEWKNYLFEGFNISEEALQKLTQLINDYSEWIIDGLLKYQFGRYINQLLKILVYTILTHIDVIFYYLQKQTKLQTQEQYRYMTENNAYDRYCQQQAEVFRNEKFLINIIKGFRIPAGLPWHLVDEVYIPINCGDEFHWVLAVVILIERRICVYDSMSRRRHFELSSEIQKLAKILPTYVDISGFLDQKIRTDWSTIEAYRDKIGNPFDVQYVEGIAQQTIDSLDYSLFVIAYTEYLSDGLQVPNNELDSGLLRKRYAALL
ncbi:hypothetical protein CQW23_12970 [Capsicum baccatum]|uniref:Ubiquitin-like protease family profile domain-containing protein n=1 Tax=Capsicum baccatum TaxID=33114 RepID=A0A2G2WU79_CAPBA|nr:hypothetical protein CQW23_12970 [Capsicum baccatum]